VSLPGAVPHSPSGPPAAAPPTAAGLPDASSAAVPPTAAGLPGALSAAVPPTAAGLPEWERLRVLRAEAVVSSVRKDARVSYALWCVVGVIGGHRFYLGDTGRSIAMLFTLGGLGVWSLLDVFFVARRVRAVNRARRAAIMARHGLIDA